MHERDNVKCEQSQQLRKFVVTCVKASTHRSLTYTDQDNSIFFTLFTAFCDDDHPPIESLKTPVVF